MDAVGREEEQEEDQLERGESGVGCDEQGGSGTRGKDARPKILHKRYHNF